MAVAKRRHTVPEVPYGGAEDAADPGEDARTLLELWWGWGEALDVMWPGERPRTVCLAAFGGSLLSRSEIGLGGGALAGDGLDWRDGPGVLCWIGGGHGRTGRNGRKK